MAQDVTASRSVLINLFERVQCFLARLDIYCDIPLTVEMMTMLGKIMTEILTILALSTKEMKERRISEWFAWGCWSFSYVGKEKFMKRLVGRTGIAAALERLDKLTQEETRTAVAKNLGMTHSIKIGVYRLLDYSYTPRPHNLFLH